MVEARRAELRARRESRESECPGIREVVALIPKPREVIFDVQILGGVKHVDIMSPLQEAPYLNWAVSQGPYNKDSKILPRIRTQLCLTRLCGSGG